MHRTNGRKRILSAFDTRLQLYSYLLLRIVTGLGYVTDVAHNRNAASRFDYGQADKLCNDRFASSPALQVTTALV